MNSFPPLATAEVCENSAPSVGVFHFSSQSSSGVTTSRPPNPSMDFWESESGTGFPSRSFQPTSAKATPEMRNTTSSTAFLMGILLTRCLQLSHQDGTAHSKYDRCDSQDRGHRQKPAPIADHGVQNHR